MTRVCFKKWAIPCLVLALFFVGSVSSRIELKAQQPAEEGMDEMFNVPLKTVGGKQFWTDHRYRGGFRVQQHAWTGHWRLLDANDVRRAWGTRETCVAKLDELAPRFDETNNAPESTVVLLHGLMRTRGSMHRLESALTDKHRVIRFSYASTRRPISEHAAALRELIEDQPEKSTFHFVGHSMGNIVVRHLIGDLQQADDPSGILPRCHSMVMLGPPNQGAAIARRLAPTKLYGMVTGTSGSELGVAWESLSNRLATPPFPFLIIAGDLSSNRLQNPLVDGASDYIVSVDEAKLEGAKEFETVPVMHANLMRDPAIIARVTEFINQH